MDEKRSHRFVPVLLVVAIIAILGIYQYLTTHPALNTHSKNVAITLNRDTCYGGCPAFYLTVQGDGSVSFVPKSNGWKLQDYSLAEAHGQVSDAQLQQLIQAFQDSGFFTMQQEYVERDTTDLASATTTIQLDGKTKQVRHYFGDAHAPQALMDLEDKIASIVNVNQCLDR